MRTAADRKYRPLKSPPPPPPPPPPSGCSAINRLQLMEYEYHSALSDLEQEQISFNIFSDVCLPVSLLILVVIWGYQLNVMSLDPDSGDNHTMMLVYGIVLIVISGTVCVYIVIRMAAMRPEKVSTFLSDEMKPFCIEEKRSQWYYYQTIPEIHKSYKKPTNIFIV